MSLAEIAEKWGGYAETPMEFYTDIFRLGDGYIQREGEPPGEFKANPLIIGYSSADDRMHRKIMFEDTFAETLDEFSEYDWAFMSGCTYFGRSNSAERQSKLYALIFDIDGVDDSNLNNFFSGASGGVYPLPQHVALSGHGVHLYYVFDEPIDLYPNIKTQVKELKYTLTRQLWNQYTSTVEDVQYQGINQAFRCPGTKTKPGSETPVCVAYRTNEHPTTIEELNGFVPEESRVDMGRRFRAAKITLEDAKEKYPEWYERVIEGNQKGQWIIKQDLYSWWLRKMESSSVTYGHRYFCVMALAIYAAKCGIYDAGRVKEDAVALLPRFNSISPDHPFTEADIDSALECLDSRYITFPRKDIARISGIEVPPNKRNYRSQEKHLMGARAIRDINNENWRKGSGRPKGSPNKEHPKRDAILAYKAAHPRATQREIAKALGVSPTTVNKWLKN